jgi:hypothetical protein
LVGGGELISHQLKHAEPMSPPTHTFKGTVA